MYQVCVWTDWIAVVVMVCGSVLVSSQLQLQLLLLPLPSRAVLLRRK